MRLPWHGHDEAGLAPGHAEHSPYLPHCPSNHPTTPLTHVRRKLDWWQYFDDGDDDDNDDKLNKKTNEK